MVIALLVSVNAFAQDYIFFHLELGTWDTKAWKVFISKNWIYDVISS